MFIFPRGLLLLACLVAVPCTHANEEPVMPTSETPILPPVAPKHPHTLKKHGDVRIDNYYWLRDDERQKPEDVRWTDAAGAELGWRWTPLASAGLYVPGGLASYPSSVLMNAIPAKVAGVERLVMVVPSP